jgi:cellulose synthase/poly-beta-1,6-N-acetylglucosamine synthase-like glycosyltransferase
LEILKILGYISFVIYFIALFYIALFCFLQFHLLYNFLFKAVVKQNYHEQNTTWPKVTVQLPIYNEKYVIERLIDSVVKFDYPKDRLEIQVLDDSTDETRQIVEEKVALLQAKGIDIKVVHRQNREGFKAGALKEGMQYANGDFIAIFDADFIPEPDFLQKTMPCFDNPEIGVVQTRWGHLNQDYSILTQLQAFQLNVHFTVEQAGRAQGGYYLQFNGTAGVWRKEAINDAGGWHADTLTEDLDLSIRSQLKGWKIHYLVDVTSPAELPVEMNGLRSQQYRWMKGGAENAKKLLPNIWKSDLEWHKKIQTTIHLLSSSVFLFIFLLGVVSVPLLFLIQYVKIDMHIFTYFLSTLIAIIIIYFIANVHVAWPKENYLIKVLKFLALFPIFISLSMGLSLHNGLAVLSGWLGNRSDFIRTPKYGINTVKDKFKGKNYFRGRLNLTVFIEGLLGFYFLAAFVYGLVFDKGYFILLHASLALGYLFIFGYSIIHAFRGR